MAKEQNAAVAAMKAFGGAQGMKYELPVKSHMYNSGVRDHRSALRYALGLDGVSIAVVGMFSVEEVKENVAYARSYEPMDPPEMEALEEKGRELADTWKDHFGPVK